MRGIVKVESRSSFTVNVTLEVAGFEAEYATPVGKCLSLCGELNVVKRVIAYHFQLHSRLFAHNIHYLVSMLYIAVYRRQFCMRIL